MKIYVETNFVLELALLQEQERSCDEIVKDCESGKATLVVPACSIAEASAALEIRKKKRRELAQSLGQELHQFGRSETNAPRLQDLREMTTLLVESIDLDATRLSDVALRLFNIAEVIPLAVQTLRRGEEFQSAFDLKPPDALVLASIFEHLGDQTETPSWFANRDSDFKDPKITQLLTNRRCKLIGRFDHALAALRGESQDE